MGRAKISVRQRRLVDLESVIERHLVGFMEVGRALLEIRSDKLYRETHPTFEAWARERFNISRRRAYELMAATEVNEDLVRKGAQVLPGNESQARGLSRLPPEVRLDVWEHAMSLAGDDDLTEKHVRRAVREFNRQQKVSKLAEISKGNKELNLGQRYPVILADPPWQYEGATADPTRQIENQYPTMSMEDICALDVEALATDDAVLFMWATAPLLQDALAVMEAWGFRYRTHAVWDKKQIGMGYWFRGQHELLLVGVRGDPPKPSVSSRSTSVISAARGKHSVKPEAVYGVIESYYPDLPKIEMFCRQPRKNWHAWGNQL